MNSQIRQMLRETANEKKIFHNVYDAPENLKKRNRKSKIIENIE